MLRRWWSRITAVRYPIVTELAITYDPALVAELDQLNAMFTPGTLAHAGSWGGKKSGFANVAADHRRMGSHIEVDTSDTGQNTGNSFHAGFHEAHENLVAKLGKTGHLPHAEGYHNVDNYLGKKEQFHMKQANSVAGANEAEHHSGLAMGYGTLRHSWQNHMQHKTKPGWSPQELSNAKPVK